MKNADYICRLEGVERGLALGSILPRPGAHNGLLPKLNYFSKPIHFFIFFFIHILTTYFTIR